FSRGAAEDAEFLSVPFSAPLRLRVRLQNRSILCVFVVYSSPIAVNVYKTRSPFHLLAINALSAGVRKAGETNVK
ncbi:MAG: hypothetical protein V2B18_23075, partial [Pseudomonadota bacterium]